MNSITIVVVLFIFDKYSKIYMDKLLYKIEVKGRVQGVWFRKYTYQKALDLGLKGFVRNEQDNSVYVEVIGDLPRLDKFVKWLYQGSPLSKVNSVDYKLGLIKKYDTFEIKS